jgi:NAD(P)H-hydrate epimerase
MLATADLMREFDRTAISSLGIPGIILMENAGRAFVDELERTIGSLTSKTTVVVCGKGNNGGDGFVIARHIANRGGEVLVVLLAARRSVRGDAKINLDAAVRMGRLRSSGLRIMEYGGKERSSLPGKPDIVVDAIFGTGFSGDLTGRELGAVSWINNSRAFVASVDIPSGVDASTGTVGNAAVMANLSVAMGLAKIGHYVGQGCDRSGSVRIADISIPPALLRPGRDPVFRVREEDVVSLLPTRSRDAHKYSAGKVLVIAGSRSFTGAPLMTADAARARFSRFHSSGARTTAHGSHHGSCRRDTVRIAGSGSVARDPGQGSVGGRHSARPRALTGRRDNGARTGNTPHCGEAARD